MLNKGFVTEGTAILAYEQTAGRGQRGNLWQKVSQEDLAVSFVLFPHIDDSNAFLFNKAITLAMCDTVKFFTGPKVRIKWPNDILYDGEKIGGLLIELTWQADRLKHAVVGIGLNLASGVYKDWVGVTSIGDRYEEVLREEVFNKLCDCLSYWYQLYKDSAFDEIRSTYSDRLFMKDQEVKLEGWSETISGKLEYVNDQGAIVLKIGSELSTYIHGPYRMALNYPL